MLINDKCHNFRSGFTLFELVIVLAIIATMVTIIVPYATRSNDSLKLDNQIQEIAETMRYAIKLAEDSNQKIRFYLDTSRKCFYLKTADQAGTFSLISTSVGRERYLDTNCRVLDIEGFETENQCYYLEFDPMHTWPSGQFVILGNNSKNKIQIESKTVKFTNEENI